MMPIREDVANSVDVTCDQIRHRYLSRWKAVWKDGSGVAECAAACARKESQSFNHTAHGARLATIVVVVVVANVGLFAIFELVVVFTFAVAAFS